MADFNIDLKMDVDEITEEVKIAIKRACEIIGQTAVRHASNPAICPVDTGRLKNSMTYMTSEHGASKAYTDDKGKAYSVSLSEHASEGEVIFGTNVEYAVIQEARKHMVRKAAGDHTSEYSKIIQGELASVLKE